MAEAGLFDEDERVELIEGEIIDVPPMGSPHAGLLIHLAALITPLVASRALVRQQLPLRLGNDSEPLPDIAVAKYREDYYKSRHPTAADVLLVIEVSSSTAAFRPERQDADVCSSRCARAVGARHSREQVHYYRSPASGRYAATGTVPLNGRVAAEALNLAIDLSPSASRS